MSPFQRVPYRARDGGQRFVGPPLIFEVVVAHCHGVLDTLVFPDEARSGNRTAVGALSAADGIASVEAVTKRL